MFISCFKTEKGNDERSEQIEVIVNSASAGEQKKEIKLQQLAWRTGRHDVQMSKFSRHKEQNEEVSCWHSCLRIVQAGRQSTRWQGA